jgi:hypothetical protein
VLDADAFAVLVDGPDLAQAHDRAAAGLEVCGEGAGNGPEVDGSGRG